MRNWCRRAKRLTAPLQGPFIRLESVKELAELKGLRELKLRGTRVTDAGMKELKVLKRLQKLYIDGTRVTGAGVADLGKAIPGVYIYCPESERGK